MSFMVTTDDGNLEHPVLHIRIGDTTVFRMGENSEQGNSISFLKTFNLMAGEIVTIEEKNLQIKKGTSSSFSLIKLRNEREGPAIVFMLLNGVSRNGKPEIRFEREPAFHIPLNNSTSFAVASSSVSDTHSNFMTVRTNGIYFVSLDLLIHFTSSDLDLTVTLGLTRETDNSDIEPDSGLSASYKSSSSKGGVVTLSLRGNVEIPTNTLISLKIHTEALNVRVNNSSRIMLTRVPFQNLIGSVETVMEEKVRFQNCRNSQVALENKPVAEYGLNKFILRNETTLVAPTNGVYLVQLKQTLLPTEQEQPESLILYFTHTRGRRVLSTIKHVLNARDALLLRDFSRMIILEKNDRVQLSTECDKKFMIKFQISFVVMATLTSPTFQVENRNFTQGSVQFPAIERQQYSFNKPGVYLVVFNIFIQYSDLTMDQKFTIKIIRQSPNSQTTVLKEQQNILPVYMGTNGFASLTSQTFLKIDSPHRTSIAIVVEHEQQAKNVTDRVGKIYKLEEHFSSVLLTNPFHSVLGLRLVQPSKKLIRIDGGTAELGNFPLSETYGGFKQEGTRMLGAFLKISKQMVILYQVSVTLEKANGIFWLGLSFSTKRGKNDITPRVRISNDNGPVGLQASGIMTLQPGDFVVFTINSETDQNVILSHCVWSLMELTGPEGHDYKASLHQNKER